MAGRFSESKRYNIIEENKEDDNKKLFVSFYGRVSKEEENQLRSLKNQKEMFGNWLEKNPDWTLYEIYTDEGITGLNTKRRHGFNKMMRDAKMGKFQVLMIKSVTRFGRNISDISKALDELLALEIRVIFLEDSIDSKNKGDIQKFGLMAWLAEIESRKISERINTTFDKMKNEGYYFGSKSPYGYNKIEGKLYINEEEAKIVRNIFDWYLDGESAYSIRNKLNEINISPPLAKNWSDQHIKRILSNPCYVGDTYTNQSRTIDLKSKIRATNSFDDWMHFPNTHEGIIGKDDFEEVQRLMNQKKKLYKNSHKPSSKHLLSNLIVCGRCNKSYTRKAKKDRKPLWNCWKYDKYGTKECSSERVVEDELFQVLESLFSNLKQNKDKLKEMRLKERENLSDTSAMSKSLTAKKEKLNRKLEKLLDLYTEDSLSKEDYLRRSEPISTEIKEIEGEIEMLNNTDEYYDEIDKMTNNLIKDIDKLDDRKNWTNTILKKHIEYIKVYDKENIEISLYATRDSVNINDGVEYLNGNSNCCWSVERGTFKEIARFQCSEVSKPIDVIGYLRIEH